MSELSTPSSFFHTGGTLSVDAPSYVERRADRELLENLLHGEFCYILTARQMGKSSLMARTAHRLRSAGTATAVIDLQASGQHVTPDQWYDGLLVRVGQQLRLEDELEDFWVNSPRLGPCQRFFNALRQVALPSVARKAAASGAPSPERQRVVLFVDELDNIRSLPFPGDEFLAAIRECYNQRSLDPDLNRLAFCLIGVATPAELIRDARRDPFNVGRRIELADFTATEASKFVTGLDAPGVPPDLARQLLDRTLHWTHGHPFLTQRLFGEVCRTCRSTVPTPGDVDPMVDRLCDELFLSARARESDENLLFVRERLLRVEADLAAVLDVYEKILAGESVPDDERSVEINQLRQAGIVRLEGRSLVVRNRIYRQVFDAAWVTAVKPIAELHAGDGRRIRIRSNFSIGRTDVNDLVLSDIKVSRRHALIQKQGNSDLYLVDLGSRNGTYLNGNRITVATLLRDKDVIDIGPHRLVISQPNAPRRELEDRSTLDRTVFGV